ncbi:MAG: DUF934 domain-containing protein [Caulobacterales bacterium]|nr:DUF934 domain-containing protein [Caulobacterales bacterium]
MPVIDINGIVKNAKTPNTIIENNIDIVEIIANFHNAECLGIIFPTHTDGRGFSIAKTIRRMGFKGIIRAIGPVIPDQFADLIACGFDEIEISQTQLERQKLEDWFTALKIYNISYQKDNGVKISILKSREV